jgi:TatD DNase family protein
MLIDTHCHLDFDRFDEDREEVVARAAGAGLSHIVVPAVDLGNVAAVMGLAERYDGLGEIGLKVVPAVGFHPNLLGEWAEGTPLEDWIESLRPLAADARVAAIGEIGLDYYWNRAPKELQQRVLVMQLELAAELEKPVILHNRDASEDLLRLLAASPLAGRERPGVLHSFSADWETAERALEMGFYVGFTGPLTYKNGEELRRIAARIPLDRLLVETDAPFLPPQPYRGKRNEPAFVAAVAERLAALHNLSFEEMARVTTENAGRLFKL